jgi:lipoprotein-anchoring transpeptidase ErfK/SrfK
MRLLTLIRLALLVGLASSASGQFRLGPKPRQPAPTPPPMRKASEFIRKQEPVRINQSLLRQITPDNVHVVVSLPKQRAYLMTGDQVVIDSPISSGKRGHSTPKGHFSVMEKDPNHRSSIYGDFVDSSGRIVRAGISVKIDSAPSGTHYVGAPMKWFMRLTSEGVGMHVGILPGYPASHGCIRMPPDGAKLFYDNVKIGTRVDVGDY